MRWCLACGRSGSDSKTSPWVRKADVSAWGYPSVEHVPDIDVGHELAAKPKPCAVCGRAEVLELHHFAPRSVFGEHEADNWPTAMLCHKCHERWHAAMCGSAAHHCGHGCSS